MSTTEMSTTAVSKNPDLIIGFSFSLMPDGSPGSYNSMLAERLSRLLQNQQKSQGEIPFVALQWEIADALFAQSARWVEKLEAEEKLFVVAPPTFGSSDIDELAVRPWFLRQKSRSVKLLCDCIEATQAASLTEALNRLLVQDRIYERFAGLELVDLIRPRAGDLFTEFRDLPQPGDFPKGLGKYQRIRVNRLIIERIIASPKLVKRGQYLSTAGVIDSVFDYWATKGITLENPRVLAHPRHTPICIEQTSLALTTRGLSPDVQGELLGATFPWDTSGAQVWCRSQENWQTYEETIAQWFADNPTQ